MTRTGSGRLVIVSNRLPVVATREGGRWRVRPGDGGLVTALAPVLRDRGGLWIGWTGAAAPPDDELRVALESSARDTGYDLAPVFLDEREKRLYYQGFANEVLWPLFHDLPSRCRFQSEAWQVYADVNGRFAEVIRAELRPDDFVWVHDYHLMQVAANLRRAGVGHRVAFFLHTPFPPLDIYLKVPRRHQLLADLLAYDLIGFQVARDLRNFVQCVRSLFREEARVVRQSGRTTITFRGREVQVGAFPISIDWSSFAKDAAAESVATRARYLGDQFPDQQIILGVDRLDYTKGLLEKLRAFREALVRWPELHERIALVQVVVPSRHDIREYSELKREVNRIVGEINGDFTRPGWVPVHYLYRNLARAELLAYYRAADIMLVTPLKDGMNLVAKEYAVANHDQHGVLVLSEFAGAMGQLHRWALGVNPHDAQNVADAIHAAWHLPAPDRRRRLIAMRRSVRRQDVFWWVNAFLQAALRRGLDDFPVHEEYVPPPPSSAARFAARG
jgi:alpha,alpha-trehalose-phosphate synthase [UDP-forming]